MSERRDARVRAGPSTASSAGHRVGLFPRGARLGCPSLWLLSLGQARAEQERGRTPKAARRAEGRTPDVRESDSLPRRGTKALDVDVAGDLDLDLDVAVAQQTRQPRNGGSRSALQQQDEVLPMSARGCRPTLDRASRRRGSRSALQRHMDEASRGSESRPTVRRGFICAVRIGTRSPAAPACPAGRNPGAKLTPWSHQPSTNRSSTLVAQPQPARSGLPCHTRQRHDPAPCRCRSC